MVLQQLHLLLYTTITLLSHYLKILMTQVLRIQVLIQEQLQQLQVLILLRPG